MNLRRNRIILYFDRTQTGTTLNLMSKKAKRLSTFMPGLGQAYAGNYTKATLFLTAELSTFALAGYNIARALHYNEQRVFETGFQDARTGEFLT